MKFEFFAKDSAAIGAASNFIMDQEGIRFEAYKCSAGTWTIGVGHTKGVKEGDTCTMAQAMSWLDEDVRKHAAGLAPAIQVDVSQNEFIAIASLAFNMGVNAIANSTLVKVLNIGAREVAADEFLKWCHERKNGKLVVSNGLLARRKRERKLFLTA